MRFRLVDDSDQTVAEYRDIDPQNLYRDLILALSAAWLDAPVVQEATQCLVAALS